MPSEVVRLVIQDPENFDLLTTDMKEMIIKGGIATVNVQAALTRKNAQAILKENFILRNNFTSSQIQFTQMPQGRYSLEAIKSTVGITEKASYMARQEEGGPRQPAGKGSRLAIPTNRARGGAKSSPVQKNYYLYKLRMVKGGGMDIEGQTYRSWLVRKAAVASKQGLIMRHADKYFTVNDFQKKAGGGVSFKMNMIYGLDREQTITPPSPWLKPAMEKPAQDAEDIFISQMKKLGM